MRLRAFFLTLFCAAALTMLSANLYAKDAWYNVRSKNFNLVGNASEKDIRLVATKLEQFRETFRQLFPRAKFTQTVQTNVVVFKDDLSYRPFKPKRADGRIDDGIAGYFQSGEDANYITLSINSLDGDAYGTIFHEYVHYMLDSSFGKSEIPPWFNEGLAEYYQTFQIENDQKVTLGALQQDHLRLLQQNELFPLKAFFEIDNYTLQQKGNYTRGVFYAQAWALMHYLIQGNQGANKDAMNKFMSLVLNRAEPEKAFQEAFGSDYATMEKALQNYVTQSKYSATVVTFATKLLFDTEMTSAALSEADANAYLGDLLYHTREYADAETYLQNAIASDAGNSLANTSLGLVKMRQRNFTDAKKYLEKAIAGDQKNHLAYYNYAFILSREAMDEFGFVRKFQPESVKKMRESLQKAIAINPNFTESYRLIAFVNLVNNENLDEALANLKKANELKPGDEQTTYILAQIYLRQEKLKDARELAEKLYKTAEQSELRAKAQTLLKSIEEFAERKTFYDKQVKDLGDKGIDAPLIVKKSQKSEAELVEIKEENNINSLNRIITKPKASEKQAIGYIQRVACIKGVIYYTVKTDSGIVSLTGKDFTSLTLMALTEEAQDKSFGCDSQVKNILAVINYRPSASAAVKSLGTPTAISFVPNFFRLKTEDELKNSRLVIVEDDTIEPDPQVQQDYEQKRREAMLEGIRQNLRTPLEGEKRELGFLERIECGNNSVAFVVRIGERTLKLKAKSPKDVKIMSFTPDAAGLQMGCGVNPPPIPVVITYRPKDFDSEIVALEFVPKSFKLE